VSDIEDRLYKEILTRRHDAPERVYVTRAEAEELAEIFATKCRYGANGPVEFKLRVFEDGKTNLEFRGNEVYVTDKPESEIEKEWLYEDRDVLLSAIKSPQSEIQKAANDYYNKGATAIEAGAFMDGAKWFQERALKELDAKVATYERRSDEWLEPYERGAGDAFADAADIVRGIK
jgi:hypothetical protein